MIPEDKITQQVDRKDESEGVQKKKHSAYPSEDIRSLADYYRIDKLTALKFLSTLKKNEVRELQDEDIDGCLKNLNDTDPDFIKTLDILYRTIDTKTPLERQCIDFVQRACRQNININFDGKDVNTVFDDAVRKLRPTLDDKKVDTLSFNLLKSLGILLCHRRNLDDEKATELLAKVLISENKRERSILFRQDIKFKEFTNILQIAKKGITKAISAQEQMLREKQQRENLRNQLNRAKEELQSKDREIEKLKADIANSESENRSLEQKIRDDQAISIHEKGELRGRSRVFLEKKLTPLLETAHEFSELEPPRKSIIIERLEMAMEEIRREIEWLKPTG